MADAPNAPAVKPAEFPDLGQTPASASGKANIDLVKDNHVMLTVELGRTDMLIQDILELTPGKVIELDRLAGEQLDIMVNGRLLAKGEVVVVDENFGIRLTQIVETSQREAALSVDTQAPPAK